MPTYATEAELVAYAAGTAYAARLPGQAGDRTRLIELAEADLDQEAFLISAVDEETGRKLVVGDLDDTEESSLSRATCAQAIYRIEMGDEHFVRAQRQRVSGRGFTKEGKLPIVGPQATRELVGGNLLQLSTSVGRRRRDDTFQSDP